MEFKFVATEQFTEDELLKAHTALMSSGNAAMNYFHGHDIGFGPMDLEVPGRVDKIRAEVKARREEIAAECARQLGTEVRGWTYQRSYYWIVQYQDYEEPLPLSATGSTILGVVSIYPGNYPQFGGDVFEDEGEAADFFRKLVAEGYEPRGDYAADYLK